MLVLHSSDLHGERPLYKKLLAVDEPFDIWVDTGDFFPTYGRRPSTDYQILRGPETEYQIKWSRRKQIARRLAEWLDGRPMVSVQGNHDFLSLIPMLTDYKIEAHKITPEGVEVLGYKWSGFRDINWIHGEWPGESHDLTEVVKTTLASQPDILVTHGPPSGILAGDYHGDYGITPLTSQLFYGEEHGVLYHFFGHNHWCGGETKQRGNIWFHNGARNIVLHEIEDPT